MNESAPEPLRTATSSHVTSTGSQGSPPKPQTPPIVPDHELIEIIGRGSYGEVWLGRNKLGTLRAIKIVYRATFEDERPFQREYQGIQKFEPVSRSHEGLVDILQVGGNENCFYYVMELADDASAERGTRNAESGDGASGIIPHSALRTPHSYTPRTLRCDIKRRGALLPDECVAIGLALADALNYLHSRGLVHRDIKPSNIVFVDGAPKLADIGLVTDVDATLSYVGTEGFMPPEGPGTPQADIYSLGKVIYEMCTGKSRQEFPDLPTGLRPGSADVNEASATPHPVPLPVGRGEGGRRPGEGLQRNKVPGELRALPFTSADHKALLELNEIFTKACAGDPRQRYQSAQEMRADLALLQRGESVKDHYVLQKRLRVARTIGLAAAAVVVVAAGVAFLWQAINRHNVPVIVADNGYGPVSTSVPEAAAAYHAGLGGLRRGTREGFNIAREQFTKAIKADPQCLPAHARLFETYLMSEDYDVDFIAEKAEYLNTLATNLVKLSPTNAETHAALAIVLFLNEYKWDDAEKEFKLALKADPNCRMALVYYGYMLTRQLRASEARKVLEDADKIDPNSPLITKFLGHCEYVQRHYEKARTIYLRAVSIDSNYPGGHYWAGCAFQALTNYQAALDQFQLHAASQGDHSALTPTSYDDLRKAADQNESRGYWSKRLETVKDKIHESPHYYAECHARVGNRAEALAGLKEAFAQHDVLDLLVEEVWDEYRHDSDFQKILKMVGLDKWVR